MKQHSLVMIIYDSVTNPVFESQVIGYLSNKLSSGLYDKAYLISFEQQIPIKDYSTQNIEIIYAQRYRFISMFSLYFCKRFVASFLKRLSHDYTLIARGPYAGYISLSILKEIKPSNLIIQARGLLTEEYTYVQKKSSINRLIVPVRAYLLRRLEQWVYNNRWHTMYGALVRFEVVSKALCRFIRTQYGLRSLEISCDDLIASVSQLDQQSWRIQRRHELGIAPYCYVYCYNGSAKAWQCIEQTLSYFAQQQLEYPDQWLMILSSDAFFFEQLISTHYAQLSNVIIKSVRAHEIYSYLSACDEGIVFREPHVLNWVARPTKVLEYQAVGLKITHNNTIGMLVDLEQQPRNEC